MTTIKPTKTPAYKTPLTAWVMALSLVVTACGGGSSTPTTTPTPTPTPSGTPSASGSPSATPTPSGTTSATSTSSGTPAAAPTPSGTPAPAPTPTASATECPFGDYKSAVVAEVNAIRSRAQVCGGVAYPAVGSLGWNSQLEAAAARHSNDMAVNNWWNVPNPHLGTDGTTIRERVPAAGYSYQRVGENVAAGQTSASQVAGDWLASASHCANMMTASFVDIGVSCKSNASATYVNYWTLVMANH